MGKLLAVLSVIVLLVALLMVFLTLNFGAEANPMRNVENEEGKVDGFWQGLLHGWLAPVSFVISLFNKNVGIYEVFNNGGWYNLGFMLGLSSIVGWSASASSRLRIDLVT